MRRERKAWKVHTDYDLEGALPWVYNYLQCGRTLKQSQDSYVSVAETEPPRW